MKYIIGILLLCAVCFCVKEVKADYIDTAQGLSFNAVAYGTKYTDFESQIPEGYRRATATEVVTMVNNIGFAGPLPDADGTTDGDATALFNSGISFTDGINYSVMGGIVDSTIDANLHIDTIIIKHYYGASPDNYSSSGTIGLDNVEPLSGHWIVKDLQVLPTATGSVSGFVTDINQNALPGMRVRLKGQGQAMDTDANGYYEFLGLSPRFYTVDVLNPLGANPKKKIQVRLQFDWTRNRNMNLVVE